jgi:HAD superfamily phosphoserine phosphatase-like hydrolase
MVDEMNSSAPPEPFALDVDPDDLATVRSIPVPRVVNVTLKPAVISDVDGTLLRWQMFDEYINIAIEFGIFPKILDLMTEDALHAYRDRRAPFGAWVDARVHAYQGERRMKGIRVSDMVALAKKLAERKGQRVHVFTRELLYAAADVGMERAFISGSMTEAVRALGEVHNVHIVIGTEQPFDPVTGLYSGEKQTEWVLMKGDATRKIAKENNLDLDQSVGIGDTSTDVAMLELVKYPICFDPNPGLTDIARQRGWPIVTRGKMRNLCFIPNARGELREAHYADILPQPLADVFVKRYDAALSWLG